MTTVYRVIELFAYDTKIKVSPSHYCKRDNIWFNEAEVLLDQYEDTFKNLEVELIEHNSQYDTIYYNEVKQNG